MSARRQVSVGAECSWAEVVVVATQQEGRGLIGVGIPKCDGSSLLGMARFSCTEGGRVVFLGDLLLLAELLRRSSLPSVTTSTVFVPGDTPSSYFATTAPSLCDFLDVFPVLESRWDIFGRSFSFLALCFDP